MEKKKKKKKKKKSKTRSHKKKIEQNDTKIEVRKFTFFSILSNWKRMLSKVGYK